MLRLRVTGTWLVLLCLISSCKHDSGDGALPEYFGLYYRNSDGLKTIPLQGAEAYISTNTKFRSAIGSKSRSAIEDSAKSLFSSCERSGEKPVFITFGTIPAPQNYHLYHPQGASATDVELGIGPIEGHQNMYKLSPKLPLAGGFYQLALDIGIKGADTPLDCLLVNTTAEEMTKQLMDKIGK